MNVRFSQHRGVLSGVLLLFTACASLAQIAPENRLAKALALEKEGQSAPAIAELRTLIDSRSLDTPGTGKAWDSLGLAYADQGDFVLARHAYEESLRILEDLPDNTREYAMALDDFGGFCVATGQFDIADEMRTKAANLYQKAGDHAGMARVSGDLAGTAFSRKKVRLGSRYLERAVKESRLADNLDDDDRAAIASLLAWQAQFHGDLSVSIWRYQQALDLLKRRHGEDHPAVGWSYLLLGNAHAEEGEVYTALAEMKHGLAIIARTRNTQNPVYLTGEISYSNLLDATGSHSEAAEIRARSEHLLKEFNRSQCIGCTASAAGFH